MTDPRVAPSVAAAEHVATAAVAEVERLTAENERLRARVVLQQRMLTRFRERLYALTELTGPLARIAAHLDRARTLATFTTDDNLQLMKDGE